MTTKKVTEIIADIREETGNTDWSDTEGIHDNTVISFINDAKTVLQNVIISVHNKEFVVSKDIDLVANTSEYTINDNLFLNDKVLAVKYSFDGLEQNFRKLKQIQIHDRSYVTNDFLSAYIQIGNKIIVSPIPANSQGKIRVFYYRALDNFDKPRGTVSSVDSSTAPTSIVLASDNILDSSKLSSSEYVCAVDKHGTVKMYAIPVGSYTVGTNTITVESGFTPQSGESISAGDIIVSGKYATTHLPVPETWDMFLKAYGKMRMLMMDSSIDFSEASQEVNLMLQNIKETYQMQGDDIMTPFMFDDDIFF